MNKTVCQELSSLVQAYKNCLASNNPYAEKHMEKIKEIEQTALPSGSGFDNGSHLSMAQSSANKLVFITAFHNMDENGFYCGWTPYTVIVTPTFGGIDMKVKCGKDADRDYVGEEFRYRLTEVVV
jgi:hypothetical protein